MKKLSPEIYKARFADALRLFHSVLFQIELYKNPKQDLSKLYAKIFNRCFKEGKQKTNPLYTLDNTIVLGPLPNFPRAIAEANVLLKMDTKILNKKPYRVLSRHHPTNKRPTG